MMKVTRINDASNSYHWYKWLVSMIRFYLNKQLYKQNIVENIDTANGFHDWCIMKLCLSIRLFIMIIEAFY